MLGGTVLGRAAHLGCTLCQLGQLDGWDWHHVKAGKLTYLAGDIEKIQIVTDWHNHDPLGISSYLYVAPPHGLQHGGFRAAGLFTSPSGLPRRMG